ncbi:MAG: hypothetical protein C4B59_02420 [Candidatus Methanogaster sp.]|uniref:Uncharacterized protein n=1 Tax=Candidatus Methanogaster sp. TaxID=3386292 RepID=A0AC61L5U1_9EURY|nr:MAG: hypothetical protein C4B59_02420 [ANME-2 cluster archaeon]
MRLHPYWHYLTRDILKPNREFNHRVRRGTRRGVKTLAFLCAYSAVIFIGRKHRITIRRLVSIPE